MQGFTLFELTNPDRFQINTGSTLSKTFIFDDYKLVVQGTSVTKSFSACDEINRGCYCDLKITGTDAMGCELYDYAAVEGRYSSGSSCELSNCRDTRHPAGLCYAKCMTRERFQEGGAEFNADNYGCFYKAFLYYKDQLIKSFTGPFIDPSLSSTDRMNQYLAGTGYTKGGERVYLTQDGKETAGEFFYSLYFGSSIFSNANSRCEDVDGQIKINAPADKFQFQITAPTAQLYTSDTAQIEVKVTQNLAPFTGKLIVEYEVPTTIGSAKKSVSTDVVVNKGVNTYSIAIPTEQVTDQIKITPALELYYDTSAWTGYAGTPYYVGKITGDTQDISIRPAAEREVIELQGQLLTAEEQIALLQASVEKKALIIANITHLLDQQGAIIAQLDLSAAENAKLIQQLTSKISEQGTLLASMNNTIQQNAQIITSMYTKIFDQARLINSLNYTVQQNAQLISSMNLKLADQALLIKNMNTTIQQNMQLISTMNAKLADQVVMINQLTTTQAEKDAYIAALLTNIAGQNSKIAELSNLVKVNSEQILKMNATIQQQVQTIAALNLNLQERERILAEVYAKLASQDERVAFLLQAIEELQLDNAEIGNLLNTYETNLHSDAALISSLKLSNTMLAQMVSGYKNDLAKEQALVSQLRLDNEALAAIIDDYEQRLVLQQDTTYKLQLSNAALQAQLDQYRANVASQQNMTALLQMSNEELLEQIVLYKANLETQQSITAQLAQSNDELNADIARYKANLITAEQLIQTLNISNQDLTALVADYDARLAKMAEYVAELNLTNEQLLQFVKALSDENEYQKQLLAQIGEVEKTPSTHIIIAAIIAVLVILAYAFYKKRR